MIRKKKHPRFPRRFLSVALVVSLLPGATGVCLTMETALAVTPPSILWSKTFGGSGDEYGSFVEQTADGGYVVAGYTESYGAGNGDFWLIKTDGSTITVRSPPILRESSPWQGPAAHLRDAGA